MKKSSEVPVEVIREVEKIIEVPVKSSVKSKNLLRSSGKSKNWYRGARICHP
ncbi:MAG: hypothetical protein U0T81_10435 [Saprospiraceae bacterium]